MRQISILWLIVTITIFTTSLSFANETTPEMIQWWKDRASQGSVTAPFQLGFSYAHGQGVEKNFLEAAK